MRRIEFEAIFIPLAIASIFWSMSSCVSREKEAYYEYKKAELFTNELSTTE